MAWMLEALELLRGMTVEIGTGTRYDTALMAESLEIPPRFAPSTCRDTS